MWIFEYFNFLLSIYILFMPKNETRSDLVKIKHVAKLTGYVEEHRRNWIPDIFHLFIGWRFDKPSNRQLPVSDVRSDMSDLAHRPLEKIKPFTWITTRNLNIWPPYKWFWIYDLLLKKPNLWLNLPFNIFTNLFHQILNLCFTYGLNSKTNKLHVF